MDEHSEKISQLTKLLQQSIALYEEDRKLAIQNYESLRDQRDHVVNELNLEMSEEGKLEKEMNTALKLVFESGKRLDQMIETLSKLMITQLNNEARERIAGTLAGSERTVQKPVDLRELLHQSTQER